MSLSNVVVRSAKRSDLNAMTDLCIESLAERDSDFNEEDVATIQSQISDLITDSSMRVVVAENGDELAGVLVVRVPRSNPFALISGVNIESMYVREDYRRRGIGHELISEVLSIADDMGVNDIVSTSPIGARSANRFLARLGFGSLESRRTVTTTKLRLAMSKAAQGGRRAALEELVAMRRLKAGRGRPMHHAKPRDAALARQTVIAARQNTQPVPSLSPRNLQPKRAVATRRPA